MRRPKAAAPILLGLLLELLLGLLLGLVLRLLLGELLGLLLGLMYSLPYSLIGHRPREVYTRIRGESPPPRIAKSRGC